jgi:hypothetical protein
MYPRTLCGSPTRLALEALFRRWSALAANSRIKALRSPCVLNRTETTRMSPAMVLNDDRYHGVATQLAGECVGRTTDRTIDLARTHLDEWWAAIYEARGKLLAHLREVLYTLDPPPASLPSRAPAVSATPNSRTDATAPIVAVSSTTRSARCARALRSRTPSSTRRHRDDDAAKPTAASRVRCR